MEGIPLEVAYPFEDGDTIVLGPGVFASKDGSVLNWNGQNYVPQPSPVAKTLKDYKVGDQVEVLKNGDWLPGGVQSKDSVSGHLHVHTERGPVTIASLNNIRVPS